MPGAGPFDGTTPIPNRGAFDDRNPNGMGSPAAPRKTGRRNAGRRRQGFGGIASGRQSAGEGGARVRLRLADGPERIGFGRDRGVHPSRHGSLGNAPEADAPRRVSQVAGLRSGCPVDSDDRADFARQQRRPLGERPRRGRRNQHVGMRRRPEPELLVVGGALAPILGRRRKDCPAIDQSAGPASRTRNQTPWRRAEVVGLVDPTEQVPQRVERQGHGPGEEAPADRSHQILDTRREGRTRETGGGPSFSSSWAKHMRNTPAT